MPVPPPVTRATSSESGLVFTAIRPYPAMSPYPALAQFPVGRRDEAARESGGPRHLLRRVWTERSSSPLGVQIILGRGLYDAGEPPPPEARAGTRLHSIHSPGP